MASVDHPHLTSVSHEMTGTVGRSYAGTWCDTTPEPDGEREIKTAHVMGYMAGQAYAFRAGNEQYLTDEALATLLAEAEARGRADAEPEAEEMHRRIRTLESVLIVAEHELTTLHGLVAYDGATERSRCLHWTLNTRAVTAQIEAVLAGEYPIATEHDRMQDVIGYQRGLDDARVHG